MPAHRQVRQLELVSDVAVEISAVRAVDDLLWEIVRQIQTKLGYYYVHLATIDSHKRAAVCRAGWDHHGPRPDLVGWSQHVRDHGLIGWVSWTGEPLLVPDVRKDARYYFDERFPETRSELTVPIKRGEEVVGVLDAQAREVGAFDNGDLMVLQTLARQVSVALTNADLFERLTASRAELENKARVLDNFAEMSAAAQEDERRRIALDLHDGIVQLLVGARFEVEALRTTESIVSPEVLRRLEGVSRILNECTADIRRVVFDLYPQELTRFGLVTALEHFVTTLRRLFKLRCRMSTAGEAVRLPQDRELAAFRFTQEALSNASRHANDARVEVSLLFSEGELIITVADSGPGFDMAAVAGIEGFGLQSMRRNAARANGRIEIYATPGAGTVVTLTIPTHGYKS
jgi:signal transduction histidine kinase